MPRLSQLSRSIEGKVALVTGAASGMGRATAQLFADEGARVAVTDLAQAAVQAVVDEIQQAGGRAACAQKMLANPDDQDARYHFACCAAVESDYETALQEWLQIIEKKPGDKRTKEAMVAVFLLLGREDELVTSYQRKLYQALH